jgi:hypothetical protein
MPSMTRSAKKAYGVLPRPSSTRGRAIAAVSVSGPSLRLTLAKLEALADPIIQTASAISTSLGYLAEEKRAD